MYLDNCELYKLDLSEYTISYAGNPKNKSIIYITKKVEHLLINLKNSKDVIIILENNIDVMPSVEENNIIVRVCNPQLEYAKITSTLESKKAKADSVKTISFKEGYYIGENVIIGKNTVIEPGVYIGHNVKIGKNSLIKSGAIIKNSLIGDNFIAGENCTIGTNGFTMAEDENGNKFRIPTLGKVSIGNNVEVGALTNISCGSAGNTIIEDFVKISSQVLIGHDSHLHKNVEITGGSIIGGFVELEENVYIGLNAIIKNRKHIGKSAIIGMGAVVTNDVMSLQVMVGNPAKPIKK